MDKKISTLIGRLKPELPTEREIACIQKIDDKDFEIFPQKFALIAMEGKETMIKMGATDAMHAGDLNNGIHTALGDMAVSSAGVYYHTVTGQTVIKYILEYFQRDSTVGIRNGDVFYSTDPVFGTTHTPDQIVIVPIFHNDELIAWASSTAHESDVGAIEPGMPVQAKTRYDDGMLLSPIKIAEDFTFRQDLLDMAGNMARNPRDIILDIKAKTAGCLRTVKRIIEEIEKRGVDYIIGGLRKLIDEAAEQCRKKLLSYHDGTYRTVVFSDSIGYDEGLVRCVITLHKKEDSLLVDLSGTSPQTPGCYNAFYPISMAALAVNFFQYIFFDIYPSVGVMEPIDFIVPKGCFANANFDASVSSGVIVAFIIQSAFHGALAKMVFDSPERIAISAPTSNSPHTAFWAGLNQWGHLGGGLNTDVNSPGCGGRVALDGVDVHAPIWAQIADSNDIEDVEVIHPHLYLCRGKFTKDLHGFGKHRGGAGNDVYFLIHNASRVVVSQIGHGSKFPSTTGIMGGYASPSFPGVQIKNSNIYEMMERTDAEIPYSIQDILQKKEIQGDYVIDRRAIPSCTAANGDIFQVTQDGGGGYGDVLERGPDAVIEDLKSNIISDWVARNVYFVSYDPEILAVDYEKTEDLRKKERGRRKERGIPYDLFEKEWSKRKPPRSILKYFGPWPSTSPAGS